MRRLAAVLVAGAVAAGCGAGGDDEAATMPARSGPAPAPEAARGPVTADEIAGHLRAFEQIARDSDGNRAAGTPGEARTTDYLARQLEAYGWKVTRQQVSWPYFENRRRPVLAGLRYREDFVAAEYSGSRTFQARVRPFDTRACDADELGELTKQDVAVVARGTCTFRRKALNAQLAGAGALVVVDREEDEPVAATLGDPERIDIPVLAATGDAAARLTRATGPVRVSVDAVSVTRKTDNVIAETGPRDDGRVVMAGAHLDSVKAGPGVNDDGSGMAALLEIARRTADTPGLRLGFWTAEEVGLFGSRHYVEELDREERERIRAYVNLDMVGTEKGRVLVYDTDDEVEDVLREHVDEQGEEDLGGDSDHAPFDDAGIPIGGVFTGLDRCYHKRCDTAANTDAAKAATIANETQRALTELAR
jgi:Iap family predicted aminopeptidase